MKKYTGELKRKIFALEQECKSNVIFNGEKCYIDCDYKINAGERAICNNCRINQKYKELIGVGMDEINNSN